ncbi:MAG: TetR/AcrR family transcriptional regulator [Pseudomonadales bacterium]
MLTAVKADTRHRLMAAANQLFLEHSIDEISISDIHAAADQKNTSAINYHFGGKKGLIMALVEPRLTEINTHRQQRVAQLESTGKPQLRDYVAALVMPQAEQLYIAPDGVVFIRLMAQLVAHPEYDELRSHLMRIDEENNSLAQILSLPQMKKMGEHIWMSRWILVMSLIYHGLADYSRFLQRPPKNMPLPEPETFFEQLVSTICVAIENPTNRTEKRRRKK